MNDYITLDGKKYHTAANAWDPNEERPMIVRRLLSGGTNVTFGPTTFTGWRGVVMVDVAPATGFGSIDDFRLTYRKRTKLSFTDHYGNTCDVVIDRTVGEKSLSPMWTAVDNVFRINLALLKL
jgi:hypothetical protein